MPTSTLPILLWDQAYNRNGDGKLPRATVNAIRTYMDNHSLSGWISQETLMRDTGLSESQVRRQIKANTEAGWLAVVTQGRAGRASVYQLTYPQPVTDDRLTESTRSPTGQIRPVTDTTPNRSDMTGYCSQPVMDDRLQPVIDDTPTTPRTSPQEKFSRVTGPEAGSLSTAETGTEATDVAEGPDSDPWGSTSEPATESRPSGLQRATASTAVTDDPFASEPVWLTESRARDAQRDLAPATAGGPPASPWDNNPFG